MATIGIVLGIISVLILHYKAFIYYKIKNPGKTVFWGYLSGLIGFYLVLSLLPLAISSKNREYYKKLNFLTYSFYLMFSLSMLFGFLSTR